MNCRIAHNLMQLELDGELAAGQREELQAHCGQCPACQSRREQLAAVRGAMRSLAAMTQGAASHAHAKERVGMPPLEFASGAASRRWRWWVAPIAAAAAIALFIGGQMLFNATRQPRVGPPLAKVTSPTRNTTPDATHAPAEEPSLPPSPSGYAATSAPRAQKEASPPARRARVEIDNPNVIAVPYRTENPKVTIIWVYPKVEMAVSADQSGRRPS